MWDCPLTITSELPNQLEQLGQEKTLTLNINGIFEKEISEACNQFSKLVELEALDLNITG